MYEAFYGLSEKPFNLTPDPKYLFLSEKHKEAFAHLLYGIKSGSGFVMVTGEIGTGKTTICRNLVQQLDSDTELAFIFNPALKPVELIKKVLQEFGLAPKGESVLDLVEELNTYLLEAKTRGRNCVLLIDEAQNLSPQVLEQIRLLSNLETETEKLLQIVLVGQPELGDMLALHELRQLNQRITARYHLKELNEKETLQYVAYRLHAAGGRRSVRFNRSAIRQVYKRSGGTPRMINAICDRALLIGYTKEAHIITSAIVKRAAVEIRGEKVTAGKKKDAKPSRWRWLPSPALLLAVVVAYFLMQQFGPALSEIVDSVRAPLGLVALNTPPSESETPPATTADAKVVDPGPVADVDVPEKPEAPEPPSAEAADSESVRLALTLSDVAPTAACEAASRTILRIWDASVPEGQALPTNDAELLALADRLGLKHERISPALSQLVALDLPAFVQLRPSEGESNESARWHALVGADDERLWLTTEGDDLAEVAWGDLQNVYADEAIVLWRDDEPKAPDMTLGRKGPYVAALKTNLRRLGRLNGGSRDDHYDSYTAMAVSKLQAETGLIVDGIAGRQVRMVLSSWLPGADTPTLKRAVPGEETPTTLEPMARAVIPEANPPAPPVPPAPDAAADSADDEPAVQESDVPAPEVAEAPAPTAEATGPSVEPGAVDDGPVPPAEDTPEPTETPPVGDDSLVSIEDLEIPFFPAGLGPLSPLDLKERTEPAPEIPPLDRGADAGPTPKPEGN